MLVTQRVSNSRVRVRHGFQLPGSGSGPVFVNFQNRVRVLPCRVSGFCRVSNLPKKEAYFGGKSEFFQVVKNFRIFFSTFMNNSLEKWIQSGLKIGSCVNALDFLGYIGSKCQISQKNQQFQSLQKPFEFCRVSQLGSGFSGFLLKSRVRVSV